MSFEWCARQSVLVHGDDDQREGWLPRALLANESSFNPVYDWQGIHKMTVAAADGDAGQDYVFHRDGTFSVKFDDNHEPRKWSGRIYVNGNIVWAKPKRGATTFDYWSVFLMKPRGEICMLAFDDPSGCRCVGPKEVYSCK